MPAEVTVCTELRLRQTTARDCNCNTGKMFFFVITGSALECYFCSYSSILSDTSCQGPDVDSRYLTNCTGDDAVCVSISSTSRTYRFISRRPGNKFPCCDCFL